MSIKRLNIQTTQHNLANGKPFDADLFNDTSESLATDLATLAVQWNNSLVPLLSLMTDGTQDTLINAYKDGADGRTIYVDSSADTSALKIRYYNTNRQRPKTIKEMLDDLYGNVPLRGVRGEKGDKGDPGTGGGGGGNREFKSYSAFGGLSEEVTNSTATAATVNAEFFIDFDKFGNTIDMQMTVIGKIGAAPYAGGVAIWASTASSVASGPAPYSALGETLLTLVEFPTSGTGGNYLGYEDVVLNFGNPGGKKFITVTSFAGATSPESDVGAVQLKYRGLNIDFKDHV